MDADDDLLDIEPDESFEELEKSLWTICRNEDELYTSSQTIDDLDGIDARISTVFQDVVVSTDQQKYLPPRDLSTPERDNNMICATKFDASCKMEPSLQHTLGGTNHEDKPVQSVAPIISVLSETQQCPSDSQTEGISSRDLHCEFRTADNDDSFNPKHVQDSLKRDKNTQEDKPTSMKNGDGEIEPDCLVLYIEPCSDDEITEVESRNEQGIDSKKSEHGLELGQDPVEVINSQISNSSEPSNSGENQTTKTFGDNIYIDGREGEDENEDINDPGWDRMKALTTEEEHYQSVKLSWKSKQIPNPHRDLTHHSYRLRRLGTDTAGSSQEDTKRKRCATSEPKDLISSKRQRMQPLPYTEFVDRKIKQALQTYERRRVEQMDVYRNDTEIIDTGIRNDLLKLSTRYNQRMSRMNRVNSEAKRDKFTSSLNKWLFLRKRYLYSTKRSKKMLIDKKHYDVNSKIFEEYKRTVDKLKEARQEILTFNQFYCGLNNLNPTLLEGKRAEEAVKIEEMYKMYHKFYR